MIRNLTLVLAFLAGLQGIVRAQDGGADSGEAEPVESSTTTPVRTAERAEVKEILRAHKLATKSRDAAAVAAALEEMVALDNKEFFGPAKAAFSYRLSKADQAWAKEEAAATGFDGDAIEIERLLHRRIELVEIAGARVLSFHDAKKAGKVLLAAFESNELRTHRSASAKTILDALVGLSYTDATDAVVQELNELRSVEMARGCIDFLVKIDTREEKAWLTLCDLLRGPQPVNVDDPTNPPQEYWEARWKAWTPIRRDVQSALRALTGRDWKADEGEKSGDADAARKWVRENAKKLGLK